MAYQFSLLRRVQFSETDLAGIMHFSNFFRWMEECEHAFYRSLGLSIHPLEQASGQTEVGWPRIKASAEYRAPLRFGEEGEVELLVAEVRTRAIRYAFRIWKPAPHPGAPGGEGIRVLAAVGELVVVAVSGDPAAGTMASTSIPETFKKSITAAPAAALVLP